MVEEKLRITGLKLFSPKVFKDERGYFTEFYNKSDFDTVIGKNMNFVQDNISCSHKNVIRGLHFQKPPFGQGKLIQVLRGKVMDVIVDLRKNSRTYGEHCKIELSDKNHKKLWIPSGFAHGFLSLENNTLLSYKCSEYYSIDHEMSLRWNDELLNIDWGITEPVVSEKDQNAPNFKNFNSPF
jgi:dTDP-4-dehydrorhamnose 3,5-epimerase